MCAGFMLPSLASLGLLCNVIEVCKRLCIIVWQCTKDGLLTQMSVLISGVVMSVSTRSGVRLALKCSFFGCPFLAI